jgi:plastocyanin
VLPVAEYEHGEDGCAVIGIGVYRGEEYPDLDGIYFSGDLYSGQVRGLQRDGNGVWQFETLLDTALQITGSGQDAAGALYMTTMTNRSIEVENAGAGSLWRLVAAGSVPADATSVPLGEASAATPDDVAAAGIVVGGDLASDAETRAADPVEPSPSTADASAAAAGASGQVVVAMDEMFFEPDRIGIPADTDVRIVLENRGMTLHNFTVRGSGISVDVESGATAETVVTLPAGSYNVVCDIPGHKEAGMRAELEVG